MNCDRAQLELSARMDGEHLDDSSSAAIDDHVGGCARCRAFARSAAGVRTAVRIRPAEPVPDLVAGIMREIEALAPAYPATRPSAGARRGPRWRRTMPAAAALVAGAVIGSVLVGGPFRGRDREAISANAIVQGVRGASPALDSFEGRYEIVEHGLSSDVPVRRLDLRVAFQEPQRFRLDLVDRTAYPSPSWAPTDVTFIQDVAATYREGPTGCPAGLPDDGCPSTRTTVTSGSPLTDLMVPAHTLGSTRGVRVLGSDTIDGHEVVTVELTFARAAPMFPFLSPEDSWRPFFKRDRVEMQLDTGSWLPRRITVFPAPTDERRAWELRFGRPIEDASTPILEVTATSVSTDAPDDSLFEIPGTAAQALSVADLADRIGYRPATPTSTGGLELEAAIAPTPGPRAARSMLVYADGLDYLRLSERPGWRGTGTFGAIGPDGVTVVIPQGGHALYAAAGDGRGRRLAIRGDDTSLFLESSLPRRELLAIAGSIPVLGRLLP